MKKKEAPAPKKKKLQKEPEPIKKSNCSHCGAPTMINEIACKACIEADHHPGYSVNCPVCHPRGEGALNPKIANDRWKALQIKIKEREAAIHAGTKRS